MEVSSAEVDFVTRMRRFESRSKQAWTFLEARTTPSALTALAARGIIKPVGRVERRTAYRVA